MATNPKFNPESPVKSDKSNVGAELGTTYLPSQADKQQIINFEHKKMRNMRNQTNDGKQSQDLNKKQNPNQLSDQLQKTTLIQNFKIAQKIEPKRIVQQSSQEDQNKQARVKYVQFKEKRDQLKEQFALPYSFENTFKIGSQNYARIVNFLSLSGWIILFALARSKNLQGIDTEYGESTYRDWLYNNAWITIILAAIFYLFNVTLTKLWASQVLEDHETTKKNKQPRTVGPQKSHLSWNAFYKFLKSAWYILTKAYEVMMTLGVVAILMIKVFWLLKGLVFFLQLNFEETSSYVLAFSFIQFGVFFGYGILLLVKLIIFRNPSSPKKQKFQQLTQTEEKTDNKIPLSGGVFVNVIDQSCENLKKYMQDIFKLFNSKKIRVAKYFEHQLIIKPAEDVSEIPRLRSGGTFINVIARVWRI